MKIIRIFLLVLIIIGVGLLATQKFWVSPFVNFLLGFESNKFELENLDDTKSSPKVNISTDNKMQQQVVGTTSIIQTEKNLWECSSIEPKTTLSNIAKILIVGDKEKAYSCFVSSSQNENVITNLDNSGMKKMAKFFENARIKEKRPDVIVYESELEIIGGLRPTLEFMMSRDNSGKWLIISW
jgi:hypothetical protein